MPSTDSDHSTAIRPAVTQDYHPIATIYNHYIEHTVITFEEQPIDAVEIAQRVEKVNRSGLPWLVAEENERIIGYAYASQWHPRSAYRHTVEVSAYLDPQFTARGWGKRLYQELFRILKDQKVHVAIGGITLPNPASEALHQKFGMRQVAHYREVGLKFGQWLDVGYWQTKLKETDS